MRPRVFTQAQAAAHVGRAERTIRSWARTGRLRPIPGSTRLLGHPLYDEPSLLRAERQARHDRARLRGVCAGGAPDAIITITLGHVRPDGVNGNCTAKPDTAEVA